MNNVEDCSKVEKFKGSRLVNTMNSEKWGE